mmetsp:Transcript_64103/g.111788  ORF Transcript_64103/g.111788 Transcript_64103/m.111788 type:complete len:223 (-) Transcript_64103:1391-2059(-)
MAACFILDFLFRTRFLLRVLLRTQTSFWHSLSSSMRFLYHFGRARSLSRAFRSSRRLIVVRNRKSMLLSSSVSWVSTVCLRKASAIVRPAASRNKLSLRCNVSRAMLVAKPLPSRTPALSSNLHELRLSCFRHLAPEPSSAPKAAAASSPKGLPFSDKDSRAWFKASAFAMSMMPVVPKPHWLKLRHLNVVFTGSEATSDLAPHSRWWSPWSRVRRSNCRFT